MTVRSPAVVDLDVAGPVEFRVLGPVRMLLGGQSLALGGSKPYGLLTLLLLTPGQAVSTPRLIAGLWGDPEPRTAAKMLQVYVSRIRQRMADSAMPGRLRTTPIGYALDVQTGELDLSSFESLTSLGRLTGPSDPAAAARLFAQALALWNGEALANVLSEPFAEAEAARLNGLRLSTLEARVDADIAAGSGPELVEELQHLVRANPTREHMAAQLMLTLYRAGRQAEALQVLEHYARIWTTNSGSPRGRRSSGSNWPSFATTTISIGSRSRRGRSRRSRSRGRHRHDPSQPLVPGGPRR